jgi:hypothetical protein
MSLDGRFANAADKSRRLPKPASPAVHKPFFPTILCALDVALFLSLLSFCASFCLFSTLSELFLQNRGVYMPHCSWPLHGFLEGLYFSAF